MTPYETTGAGSGFEGCFLKVSIQFLLLFVLLVDGMASSHAAMAGETEAMLKAKEKELSAVQAQSESIRQEIRRSHQGSTKEVEAIIRTDLKFEQAYEKMLTEAKGKLRSLVSMLQTVEEASSSMKGLSASLGQLMQSMADTEKKRLMRKANKKLYPYFFLDENFNVHVGHGFLGSPAHFPTPVMSIESALKIIDTFIEGNSAMMKKRRAQLAVLEKERGLASEIRRLRTRLNKEVVSELKLYCRPNEISPNQVSHCRAEAKFGDGSVKDVSSKVTWSSTAPGGRVEGRRFSGQKSVEVTAVFPVSDRGRKGTLKARARVKIAKASRPDEGLPHARQDRDSMGSSHHSGSLSLKIDCSPGIDVAIGDGHGRICQAIITGIAPGSERVGFRVDYDRKVLDVSPDHDSKSPSSKFIVGGSYPFALYITADWQAPEGSTTSITVTAYQGANKAVVDIPVQILKSGKEVSTGFGTRPSAEVVQGVAGGPYCVWRFKMVGDPPECFNFVGALCSNPSFRKNPNYELVGENMLQSEMDARIDELSRYFKDKYGCYRREFPWKDECPQDPKKTKKGVCGCGVPDTDRDGDGTPDCNDQCPRDPAKIHPGICGCGISDEDSDGDGTPDCNDQCPDDASKTTPGTCGCGRPETDSDGDAMPDCVDRCPDDPRKTAPGYCGCGKPETDTDLDGRPDCADACPNDPNKIRPGLCGCGNRESRADSDGDGTPDCVDKCPNDPEKTEPGNCGCGRRKTGLDLDHDGMVDCQPASADRSRQQDDSNPMDSSYLAAQNLYSSRDTERSQSVHAQAQQDLYHGERGHGRPSLATMRDRLQAGLESMSGIDECHRDSDCASHQVCVRGRCVEDESDGRGQDGAGASRDGSAVADRSECHSSSECASGQVCRSGRCVDSTRQARDCRKGTVCPQGYECNVRTGRCDKTSVRSRDTYCSRNSDCRAGETCRSGHCVKVASRGSRRRDCRTNYVCKSGYKCNPRTGLCEKLFCKGHDLYCREPGSRRVRHYRKSAWDKNMDNLCDLCGLPYYTEPKVRRLYNGLTAALRGDIECSARPSNRSQVKMCPRHTYCYSWGKAFGRALDLNRDGICDTCGGKIGVSSKVIYETGKGFKGVCK